MFAYYGNRFLDFWGNNPQKIESVKKIWAEELAGYTALEIKAGLEACRKKDYPPSLPQFLSMCRPPLNAEAAFYEAVDQYSKRESGKDRWSSPVIYWAMTKLGNDINCYPYETLKKRWENALQKSEQEIREGLKPNSVPERAIALVAPGETTLTREEREANLKKISDMLKSAIKKID